jgi:pectin methylesterase-like acyl-CoA thioesterase
VGLALSVGVSIGAPAATTWTLCASGCDYTSIKAAIAAPTTLDGDTLAIGAGIYTEAGITVDKNLTLQGEAAATTIV